MNGGLLYIPKFVKQESDLEYGSVVTHENYNEKLNLNTSQGDYNTEVLRILMTEKEADKTYHIPYLDKIRDDDMEYIEDNLTRQNALVDSAVKTVADMEEQVNTNKTGINQIILGLIKAGHANVADNLSGAASAGVHKYYGTDYSGNVGYHEVPDNIFAKDISAGSVEISGILFTPRENSITEDMMTETVRSKLNRSSITEYPQLNDLPYLAGVKLVGDISLEDIGAQHVGNYLTEIPSYYTIAIKEYADTKADTAKSDAIDDAASKYATIIALQNLQTQVDSLSSNTSSTYAKVFVQSSTPTGAKNGDIWVNV